MSFPEKGCNPDHLLPPRRRTWVRRRLLTWFARHARPLPWRLTRDPYAIWVSEVMLQQTQVAAVIPYFHRFLASFPDIGSLARADIQEVLRHWEGLGYYRRARDLHRAAEILQAEHAGLLPDNPEVLHALPGLGPYMVAAVLSQAFEHRLPILETNSLRVLCRFLGMRADPKKAPARRLLWRAAAILLPIKQVGQFNQALMELGALVCTPSAPACPGCPLARHCRARLGNLQERVPFRAQKQAPTTIREVALVLRRGREVLLAQRPATGRWASLWEFPHTPLLGDETSALAAARLLEELGLSADVGGEIVTLKHAVTRYRITLICLEAHYRGGRLGNAFYQKAQWLVPQALGGYPVSSPQRRLAQALSVFQNGCCTPNQNCTGASLPMV